MNCMTVKEKYRTKQSKTKTQKKIHILSYYPDQIEKFIVLVKRNWPQGKR